MNNVEINNIPEWVAYIATDADGYEYGYEHKPIPHGLQWIQENTESKVELIKEGHGRREYFSAWRESLVEVKK